MKIRSAAAAALWALLAFAPAPVAFAQETDPEAEITAEDGMVQLDFQDVELSVVIDTIARLTGRNFIYDDRVRGRVTIVSPTKVTIDQAYAVFESVLQVKGFTTVAGPGNATKIIPIREAKESSIKTVQGRRVPPSSDRYVTRLIPLQYIDAEAITNTLKPLVSKDAAMVAYAPTNTVILTDAATNIRRILNIIESIDVETYKEELSVIKVQHADAATMADQIAEIYGAEQIDAGASARTARSRRRTARQQQADAAEQAAQGKVRIITDERTNSLIILASRSRTEDIREVIRRLDVPVTGGGRIHVYYLKHADAEELAETLNALISGQPAAGAAGDSARSGVPQAPQAIRAMISELAEGVMVTADPPTNALVIQASQEGYSTLSTVIAALDIERPQVLVEALLLEVDVTDEQNLGFTGIARVFRGNTSYGIGSVTGSPATLFETPGTAGDDGEVSGGSAPGALGNDLISNLIATATRSSLRAVTDPVTGEIIEDAFGRPLLEGSLIQGIITASAANNSTNVLSSPHVLTSDNEEAEIKVGANIPIITSRVESAAGIDTASNLATSVNVERQDIGVTLRVTPQISEGDQVRLEIFEEITDFTGAFVQGSVGNVEDVGVALTNRKIENTVVVQNGETVVIGGLIQDDYEDIVDKVPWLGDIPLLGWLFKSTRKANTKTNLISFLTPYIVRTPDDLERETIRKRVEFRESSQPALALSGREKKEAKRRQEEAKEAGLPLEQYVGKNPVRAAVVSHEERYPLERMAEIERAEQEAREREAARLRAAEEGPAYGVLAAVYGDEQAASGALTELIDAGLDGTLRASDAEGQLVYELHLGPYETLEAAEQAAELAREAFGLVPQVTVVREEETP